MPSDNNSLFSNRKSVPLPAPIHTSLLSPQLHNRNATTITSAPPIPISVRSIPDNSPPQPKRRSSLSGPSGAKAFLMAMGMTSSVGIQDQINSTWSPAHINNNPFSLPAAQLSRTRSWNAVNSPKLNTQRQASSLYSPTIPFVKSRTISISDSCHSSHSSQPQSPAASFLLGFTERCKLSPTDDEGEEVGGYVLGKVLGRGMFSVVRKAFTMRGQLDKINAVAVKIIKKEPDAADPENNIPSSESNAGQDSAVDESSSTQSTLLDREIDIWRQLEHPHLLRMIEVIEHPQTTYIFSDFCPGGNMLNYLRRTGNPGLPEPEAARLWTQLASAVLYLHEILRVVHRDIKLENILLNENGDVKLGDFGFADYVRHQHRLSATPATMGSLAYCAPELVRPQKKSTTSVVPPASSIPMKLKAGDSWALGVILFAFVTGSLPFADEFEPRMILKISNVQYAWSSSSTNLPPTLSSSGANTAPCSPSSETSPSACAFPSPSLQVNTSSPLANTCSGSSSISPTAHSSYSSFFSAPAFEPASSPVDQNSSRTDPKSMGSPPVRSLVAGLLNAKWRDRWTVRTALENSWVKSFKS